MGADIYIESIWKKKYRRVLAEAKACGDPDGTDAEASFYDLARATGVYFRNGYNNYDVMFAMGLSWWGTVQPMLDTKSRLPIERARELIAMIEARPINKQTFGLHYLEMATGAVNPIIAPLVEAAKEHVSDQTPMPFAEMLSALQKRRDELLTILRKSIELNEPLVCSL